MVGTLILLDIEIADAIYDQVVRGVIIMIRVLFHKRLEGHEVRRLQRLDWRVLSLWVRLRWIGWMCNNLTFFS